METNEVMDNEIVEMNDLENEDEIVEDDAYCSESGFSNSALALGIGVAIGVVGTLVVKPVGKKIKAGVKNFIDRQKAKKAAKSKESGDVVYEVDGQEVEIVED